MKNHSRTVGPCSLIAALTVGALTPDGPAALQAADGAAGEVPPALSERLAGSTAPAKAWVFFADKGVRSPTARVEALRAVASTYDSRAVARRQLRGAAQRQGRGVFDECDLPVEPGYVAAVAATGARVHVTSRWLNAISAYATREQVAQIAALPFVVRLQPVARAAPIEPIDAVPAVPVPFSEPADRGWVDYGRTSAQLTQINLIALHQAGYTGLGVIVGILDTGFHRTHVGFNDAGHPLNVIAEYDFLMGDGNTDIEPGDYPDQFRHGTLILGVLAAYWPGQVVGGAYDAGFVLCKTEDYSQEVPAEEDNFVAGLEFIEAHGGDMVTSSLGYIDWYTQADLDGATAVTTIAVNTATALGVHCCTAVGNSGHDSDAGTSHLIAPADAPQVITCGAVDPNGVIASFSSDGPTADGRVKPELLARGINTYTVSPYYDNSYTYASGTSLSTPLVASAVACLIQAHPDWTVEQMRGYLFQSADYYRAHFTYDPQYVRGYGVPNAYAAAQDCNGNGVPDLTDLALGTARDCNANGVLDECEFTVGDVNCDGTINYADINPFVLALSGQSAYHARYPSCDFLAADCNHDCQVNYADIDAFVFLLNR